MNSLIKQRNGLGNSKNLAEELMKKLPNAMLQQIYKVR